MQHTAFQKNQLFLKYSFSEKADAVQKYLLQNSSSRGSCCLSSLCYSHGREEKEIGGSERVIKKGVDRSKTNYGEILLENIKEVCTQHFKEKRNCDVLASEQRPSCTHLDQVASLNLIFLRFKTPA